MEPKSAFQNETLIGSYQLLQKAGEGAMGVVYQVEHSSLKKKYALKILRPDPLQQDWNERFQREIQIMAKLKHPYLLQIVDSGTVAESPYYVMEWMESGSLASKLEQGISLSESVNVLQKVLQGLHYIHQQGILHRDLKLENIFLEMNGDPKIADFGVAGFLQEDPKSQQLTHAGEILGTPYYAPPELLLNQKNLNHPLSDVYAAGVCLYKLLTTQYPYPATSFLSLIYQMHQEEPVPPVSLNPEISKDLEAIVLKAIHKNPQSRYQTAQEFEKDLKNLKQGYPISARPSSFLERVNKGFVRNRKKIIALLCFLLATLTATLYFWSQHQKKQKQFRLTLAKQTQQLVQEALQDASEDTNKSSSESIKKLLSAFHSLNSLRMWEPASPQTQQQKVLIGKKLQALACESKAYPIAHYALAEIDDLIPESEMQSLLQSIHTAETEQTQQHLKRWKYWEEKLKSGDYLPEDFSDALFEIRAMEDEEVFQHLLKHLNEGTIYFLEIDLTQRSVLKNQFYFRIVELLKYLQHPQSEVPLKNALEQVSQSVSHVPKEERPTDQMTYMNLMTQALEKLKPPPK